MRTGEKFERLVEIMAILRSENGCPWDKEQTHLSLRPYLIEETYEVLEMLDEENIQELPKELGDLLLQIIFHAQIAFENKNFTINTIIDNINEKLVSRHPHVFGHVKINSAQEQSIHWEKVKRKEGKKSVLDGVPQNMPALGRAQRLQQKAATVGFDWPSIDGVWDKLHEEIDELKEALEGGQKDLIEDEFGDLLFAAVNLGRFINANAEDSLRKTIRKFTIRFKQIEKHFAGQGRDISTASLDEMENVWQKVKKKS
ncbi:MAG: nucleoside triphosphate pyrophosphohydrolase [Deferribacteres bacterium]|nr:nucleoside triphosphate pyrophosphohydrolase [candidate division KSB1 bacterium]MCB9501839.1 nucleoside triphosphate pyrophosphohydrolase [Deferribacteres bacterium]